MIYVDNIVRYSVVGKSAQVQRVFAQGSCHLFTDEEDLDNLHRLAAAIGMKRAWFQAHGSLPHYDLNTQRRELAIKAGAVPCDRRKVVEVMRLRQTRLQ